MSNHFNWMLLLPELVLTAGGVVILLLEAIAISLRRSFTVLAVLVTLGAGYQLAGLAELPAAGEDPGRRISRAAPLVRRGSVAHAARDGVADGLPGSRNPFALSLLPGGVPSPDFHIERGGDQILSDGRLRERLRALRHRLDLRRHRQHSLRGNRPRPGRAAVHQRAREPGLPDADRGLRLQD